jgi:hypothetical protein
LSGSIPAGQTVTVDGAATSVSLGLAGTSVTDHGTLIVAPTTNGFALLGGSPITVASGGLLSTTGSGNPAYIRTNVTTQAGGIFSIGAIDTRQDQGTTTANAGTFQVVNGGHYSLTGALTNTATSTLGVTVNGTAGTGGISGTGLALNGTLAVTTVGSPSVGSAFTPITGPVTGTFSAFSFGSGSYGVTYPSASVLLTATTPFSVAPTAFTPQDGVATGPVQVASIGGANFGTGAYTATVNYGDGSPVVPATVAVTGSTGTVTGPTHTYTTLGAFTVTVTVTNADGTSLVATQTVHVNPSVSGFSKSTIKQSKKLSTVISGTGLNSSAVVTTSNPGVTVISVKAGKVSAKHPNPTLKVKFAATATATLGSVSVTITETGGSVTVTNALTVVVE